ncbi:MAG: Aspartate/tyrosine/aromaticaminotransferase [Candidatus Roizmanbacteria bacterium GW2011_GWA2_35_8]|uniref:Aspartate/tyrosine/aromaticaminotransferase n=1 Tax=Candidatus Roizmanbacteria bacterium GW2011_GWA2_35_8 TaxID=1618479 RepID=A0A0G0CYG2_9BACT|nr:MAG: Aspartate/tyrosine/aromaticaminotransferase [Candidatus Roizmanbacteria bacterium GW2011_GWA2_35_8]
MIEYSKLMSTDEYATKVARSKIFISEVVETWKRRATTPSFNILRGMRKCRAEAVEKIKKEGLPAELAPVDGTIGDIYPGSIKGELEKDFFHLLGDLYLDPRTEGKYWEKEKEKHRLLVDYANKGIFLTFYDSYAKGTKEARELIAEEAREIGIDSATSENIWMAEGGMGALTRIFRMLNWRYNKDHNNPPRLLASVPSFVMTLKTARREGFTANSINSSDLPKQELTGERLAQYFEQDNRKNIPNVFLITPANNPTAMSYDPETLRGVIKTMQEYNPNVQFVFDMAYMSMIPNHKAKAIMAVIHETGADKKALFAISESKVLARPGTRIGAIMTLDTGFKEEVEEELEKPLGQSEDDDNMDSMPSYSGELDVEFQAIRNLVNKNPEILEKYFALLRQRQFALLEALREVGGDFFVDMEKISIPGYESNNPEAVDQDVPLYLWLKVKKGADPFDIIKKLNIVGAPSQAFGIKDGFMRFSVGYSSTNELLSIAPETLRRWSS